MGAFDGKKRAAERAYSEALSRGYAREAEIFRNAAEQIIVHDNPAFFDAIARMNKVPATIDEFVESNEFLAGVDFNIWPTLRDDLCRMNPDVMAGETPIYQTFLGGATGTGKSHLSTGTLAYQVYLMSCFDVPQRLFGLTPATTIVFMLQSVSPTITKRVLYDPFRKMFTAMPYVRRHLRWNDRKESVLEFENNLQIVPAPASLQAILGQAVAGAILDEVNFMQIVENSKTVAGPQGLGGKFDQAEEIYSNIERRRTRSFTTKGVSIGSLCIVSSTRYKNDFLDRKINEMETIYSEEPEGTPKNFLTFRHRQYEVNPRFAEGRYSTFRLLVGTDEYQTRVLEDFEEEGIHYPEGATIIDIPMPYKAQFKKDPDAAIRDVVGIATDAISPFFRRRGKIAEAMTRGLDRGLELWTNGDEFELMTDGMPEWIEEQMPVSRELRERPHFIHVDLSKTADRCGIAVVRFDGMVEQRSADDPAMIEMLPKLTVVTTLGIQPSVTHEIDIAEIRGFCLALTRYGFNVASLTYDGFASAESIQMTRHTGVHSDIVSVDRTPTAYQNFRDMLYQDRVDIAPDSQILQTELNTVEWYPEKNKVDHPPRGTKDVADAVVGACQAALDDRSIRARIEVRTDDGERHRNPRPQRRPDYNRRQALDRR